MGELIQEYTRNISTGGIFLKTERLLDPNAMITLTMEFPGDLGTFLVRGKVVRLISVSHPDGATRQLHGAGIRFVHPDPQMIQVIEELVRKGPPENRESPP